MANMLEGGGKTPILPPEELQALGFSLVAYPLSLLGVSIRAMENALSGLKSGRVPDVRDMGTFVDIQMAVGFPVRRGGGRGCGGKGGTGLRLESVKAAHAVYVYQGHGDDLSGLKSGCVPVVRDMGNNRWPQQWQQVAASMLGGRKTAWSVFANTPLCTRSSKAQSRGSGHCFNLPTLSLQAHLS